VTSAAWRTALAGIAGDVHVRDAAPGDAAGGVMPSVVVAPADEAQVAEVLACASRERLAVVVRGGGTKLDWGAPPRACDVVLSTSRLDALVEHEPGDLVCVVQAGMPLAALQDALAPHGQRLALDPPQGVQATLGGIMATRAHGPLRTRYGTARDLVIGARFVLSDGTVGHSGGKVVKNVAGYDLAKLLCGSLGTLAVTTQVALRLHPLPHTSRTVVFEGESSPAAAAGACRAVDAAGVAPARLALLWPAGDVVAGLEGTEAGVEADLAALRALPAAPRPLDDDEAAAAWSRIGSAAAGADAAIAVPRTELGALLARLRGAGAHAVVLPSLGVADVALRPGMTPDELVALRAWAESAGGHLVVRRPTPALAAHAWPEVDPVAADLMRSLKRALDPTGTLAPGRFAAGI